MSAKISLNKLKFITIDQNCDENVQGIHKKELEVFL